jgi:hypothetical protein
MKQIIVPWLATFLFGCAVFLAGKAFQSVEKKRREERKAEIERAELAEKLMRVQEREARQGVVGIMAAVQGQGQQTGNRFVH